MTPQPREPERADGVQRRCHRCGNLAGHVDMLADAHCAYRHQTTGAIIERAERLGVGTVASVDLLAHLRGRLSDEAAYRTACYVLDLGWRPAVGVKP